MLSSIKKQIRHTKSTNISGASASINYFVYIIFLIVSTAK